MRVLVSGGTGYLGSELVRRGCAGFSSREADVREAAAVEHLFREHRPQVVIHTAYRQSEDDAWSVNVDGARVVAREAAAIGARLIHMSTDVVFDGRKGGYVESDRVSPITAYGLSKAAAEAAVAAEHPRALVVRTSLLYGGATPSRHERDALELRFPFFTDELRCPTHVGDLADALLELAYLPERGILHVAASEVLSRCQFAERLARRPVPCTTSVEAGVVRPLNCSLDSSRANVLLRTRLRPVSEVLG